MRTKTGLLAGPYIFWMVLFIVLPMLLVVYYAFTGEDGAFTLSNFSRMLDYTGVFIRSMGLAALATAVCILIGYPLAYALTREPERLQKAALLLIMLPMWINLLLRTYAWSAILDKNGFLNRLLGLAGLGPFKMINTPGAVVLGMVYNYLPFMILPIFTVIQKIDRSLIEAAQDLGSDGLSVFKRVILPLSLPGVLSGVTMVFVPSISTFVISQMLGGGKFLLLGDLIETQFLGNAYNPYLGSAISLVMMVVVMISMAIMNRFGEGEEEVVML